MHGADSVCPRQEDPCRVPRKIAPSLTGAPSRGSIGEAGRGWLLAFLAIPVLLALIGWGALDRANDSDELALPSVDPSATLSVPTRAPNDTGTARPVGGYPPCQSRAAATT